MVRVHTLEITFCTLPFTHVHNNFYWSAE